MANRTEGETILDVLEKRPIVGDGGYVFCLEKRGYLKPGPWTPEVVIEHPEAVVQLHKEFKRAGSDVLQAFTFYASGERIQNSSTSKQYTVRDVNQAACDIVKDAAKDGGAFTCGGITPAMTLYKKGQSKKEDFMKEFRKQQKVFVDNNIDFLLAEFFIHIEEAEWAVETMKETHLPVAVTMRIGPTGDKEDVSPGECAVRLVRAGADIVGLNCQFDPETSLKTIAMMKDALDKEGLKAFLILQPVGYRCSETEVINNKDGYMILPEYPFAMEPRILTRAECRDYARSAFQLGVHYIGGCCGFEPFHIREVADELSEERGFQIPGHDKYESWGTGLRESVIENLATKGRNGEAHWRSVKTACGVKGCPGVKS